MLKLYIFLVVYLTYNTLEVITSCNRDDKIQYCFPDATHLKKSTFHAFEVAILHKRNFYVCEQFGPIQMA